MISGSGESHHAVFHHGINAPDAFISHLIVAIELIAVPRLGHCAHLPWHHLYGSDWPIAIVHEECEVGPGGVLGRDAAQVSVILRCHATEPRNPKQG